MIVGRSRVSRAIGDVIRLQIGESEHLFGHEVDAMTSVPCRLERGQIGLTYDVWHEVTVSETGRPRLYPGHRTTNTIDPMDWYWWLGLFGLLAVCVLASVRLLGKITAWGGNRSDGLEQASRFAAEAEAYRGSRTPDNATMDGKNRIAPPTTEGGGP